MATSPPPVWPYPPLSGMSAALQWSSQVLRAYNGEQRISLRDAPRLSLRMNCRLSAGATQAMRFIMRNEETAVVRVPDWRYAQRVNGIVGSGSTSIPVDGTIGDYDGAGEAILWVSADEYHAASVSASGSTLTLGTGPSSDMAYPTVAPLREMHILNGASFAHQQWNYGSVELNLLGEGYTDLETSGGYSLGLGGHEVYTGATFDLGSVGETLEWPRELIQTNGGPIATEAARGHYTGALTLSADFCDASDLWDFELFLHRRKGRVKPFWLATGTSDFRPASAINGTSIVVPADGAEADYEGLRILLRTRRGELVHAAEITGASLGGSDMTLTIDPGISGPVSPSDIEAFSEMSLVRLATDRPEMLIDETGRATVGITAERIDNELQ